MTPLFSSFQPRRSFATCRGLLAEAKVRPVIVVVKDVFIHQPFQMPLVHNDHVVEQIPATTPNPAFCNAVLPGTAKAGSSRLDSKALYCADHIFIVGVPGSPLAGVLH